MMRFWKAMRRSVEIAVSRVKMSGIEVIGSGAVLGIRNTKSKKRKLEYTNHFL